MGYKHRIRLSPDFFAFFENSIFPSVKEGEGGGGGQEITKIIEVCPSEVITTESCILWS